MVILQKAHIIKKDLLLKKENVSVILQGSEAKETSTAISDQIQKERRVSDTISDTLRKERSHQSKEPQAGNSVLVNRRRCGEPHGIDSSFHYASGTRYAIMP